MHEDLAENPLPPEAVPHLRYLRRLVTGLAVVLGGGMIAIVAILCIRLVPSAPVLPHDLPLPKGAQAAAVTVARDFTIVVTDAGEILLYDASGRLAQRITPAVGLGGPDR